MIQIKKNMEIIATLQYSLGIIAYILAIAYYLPKHLNENKKVKQIVIKIIYIVGAIVPIVILSFLGYDIRGNLLIVPSIFFPFLLSYIYFNFHKSITDLKNLLDEKEVAFEEQGNALEESKARIAAMQEKEEKSKFVIINAQLSLFIYLLAEDNLLDYKSLKCTFHVPFSLNENEYLQAFDYIPIGKGGGRIKSINKGLVGKTFKEKKSLVENFESDEEHNRKMITEYNFRSDEIQNTNNRTNSYFTYPILDDFKVLGVIYFESKRVNTFTSDKNTPLMKQIYAACYGIGRKYPWNEQ